MGYPCHKMLSKECPGKKPPEVFGVWLFWCQKDSFWSNIPCGCVGQKWIYKYEGLSNFSKKLCSDEEYIELD